MVSVPQREKMEAVIGIIFAIIAIGGVYCGSLDMMVWGILLACAFLGMATQIEEAK